MHIFEAKCPEAIVFVIFQIFFSQGRILGDLFFKVLNVKEIRRRSKYC